MSKIKVHQNHAMSYSFQTICQVLRIFWIYDVLSVGVDNLESFLLLKFIELLKACPGSSRHLRPIFGCTEARKANQSCYSHKILNHAWVWRNWRRSSANHARSAEAPLRKFPLAICSESVVVEVFPCCCCYFRRLYWYKKHCNKSSRFLPFLLFRC